MPISSLHTPNLAAKFSIAMEVPAKPAEALEAKATNATAAAQGGGPKGGTMGGSTQVFFSLKNIA
jgi:hypothetical protein